MLCIFASYHHHCHQNQTFVIMKNFRTFSCFVLLLCVAICGVHSIRCYQCSSADDPKGDDNCGAYEDFYRDKHVAVECNSDESKTPGTFCMKITQQGPRGFIWDGRWRQVIRQCASVAENGVTGVCNWGVRPNGVYWEKCYCSEDGCNHSNKLRTSLLLLVIFSVILYTFY